MWSREFLGSPVLVQLRVQRMGLRPSAIMAAKGKATLARYVLG